MNITQTRLYNEHLLGKKFATPAQAVSHLGAVQSQDYPAAKWALGLRVNNATDNDIEKAFNEGTILRTHVMRPTWHFVMPEDIRWMLELTKTRIKSFMSYYNRKLELDDALFAKTNTIIAKSLQNHNYLTRQELKKLLTDRGVKTDVQRLGHIVSWAELDGLIISGPRRGKQFTYALLEERAPKTKKLTREESLSKLASKYFTSHGPAQLKDFSWWSGLTIKDANEGLGLIKSKLANQTIDNKTYWFSPNTKNPKPTIPIAFLLSIYDEYTIAYKDRSDLSEGRERDIEKMISMGNALTAVIILDGKVIGTWKRELKKDKALVKVNLFRKLNTLEKHALETAVTIYGKFLGVKATLL